MGSEPQESGPPARLQKQCATVSLLGILLNCFFFSFLSPASLSDCVCSELLFVCCFQCFSPGGGGWMLHTFSPLDFAAPSQSLIAFFLQVTERFKEEKLSGLGVPSSLT